MKSFQLLAEKVEQCLEAYAELKKEKQRIESQCAKKDREINCLKSKIDRALKEREAVRRKIDDLLDRIDTLDV